MTPLPHFYTEDDSRTYVRLELGYTTRKFMITRELLEDGTIFLISYLGSDIEWFDELDALNESYMCVLSPDTCECGEWIYMAYYNELVPECRNIKFLLSPEGFFECPRLVIHNIID